jgi:hypothetical protein
VSPTMPRASSFYLPPQGSPEGARGSNLERLKDTQALVRATASRTKHGSRGLQIGRGSNEVGEHQSLRGRQMMTFMFGGFR